jgi:hypothetical protein
MISPVTGEVVFSDGLRFSPHEELSAEHIRDAVSHAQLPIPGWTHHLLGIHPAAYGRFEVEAISDRDSRIQAVMAAHLHPFYRLDTPEDSERRVFHEGIIAQDLHGQREFKWGTVYSKLEIKNNKDWLVIVYTTGPQIPLQEAQLTRYLSEREPLPGQAITPERVKTRPD